MGVKQTQVHALLRLHSVATTTFASMPDLKGAATPMMLLFKLGEQLTLELLEMLTPEIGDQLELASLRYWQQPIQFMQRKGQEEARTVWRRQDGDTEFFCSSCCTNCVKTIPN